MKRHEAILSLNNLYGAQSAAKRDYHTAKGGRRLILLGGITPFDKPALFDAS